MLLYPGPTSREMRRLASLILCGADAHYLYADKHFCILCRRKLSRLNPHVMCFRCISRERTRDDFTEDEAARKEKVLELIAFRRLPDATGCARKRSRKLHRFEKIAKAVARHAA